MAGRVRFVVLGLVIGVFVAVVIGQGGCGSKDKQHARGAYAAFVY